MSDTRRTFFIGDGWFGVRLGRLYVSARGPQHQPLFSERNRIRTRVLPLLAGWRLVARFDPPGRVVR